MLEVQGLSVGYRTRRGPVPAVRDVWFDLPAGEVLGLVGESGSGKSTVAQAVLGLLPRNGRVSAGRVLFRGEDLLRASPRRLRELRWSQIAVVLQSAMGALDPVYRVEDQIAEGVRAHARLGRSRAVSLARGWLERVGIPAARGRAFPHELSGGMRQRVGLAMAVSLEPALIIADEPTTALDLISQDRVLAELAALCGTGERSMIFVTHDLAVVAELCQRVVVMYGGAVMERAPVGPLFRQACHPYTLGLLNAIPRLGDEARLVSIPGAPPSVQTRGDGCPFYARCPFRAGRCLQETPRLVEVAPDHAVACHFPERAAEFRERAADPATWEAAAGA